MKNDARAPSLVKKFALILVSAVLATAFFVALSFILTGPAMDGPLVLDDGASFADNPAMHIDKAGLSELWRASLSGPNRPRLLPKASFALDYLRDGLSPRAFRETNAVLHGLCAAAFFLLLVLSARAPALKNAGWPAGLSFLAALLWCANPVQTQAVSYVVQRMTVMASLFYVLCLCCYAGARLSGRRLPRAAGYVLCALFGAMAMASKENTILLFFFLPAYELLFFQDSGSGFLKKRWPLLLLGLAAAVAVGLLYTGFRPVHQVANPYEVRSFSMAERLLTQPRVVLWYVSLFLLPLPSRLALDHSFPLSRGLFSPPDTFFAIAAIALLLLFALAFWRRRRVLSFIIIWYFGNLAIESSIFPLEMVFEHRIYLPSMALAILLPLFLYRLFRGSRTATVLVMLALCALCAWGTLARNRIWGDELAFYRQETQASPEKSRPHYLYAGALLKYGKPEEALAEAKLGAGLDPRSSDAFYNLGRVLSSPEIDEPEAAVAAYVTAVKNDPANVRALNDLMIILAAEKKFDAAHKVMADTLALYPEDPQVWVAAGMALFYEERYREAAAHFSRAVALDRDFIQAHYQLGLALARAGLPDKALPEISLALIADPLNPEIARNAALAQKDLGRYREAISTLSGLLMLKPDDLPSRFLLAYLHYDTGDHPKALAEFDRLAREDAGGPLGNTSSNLATLFRRKEAAMEAEIKRLSPESAGEPGDPGQLLRLGLVYKNLGRWEEARQAFEKAARLAPDSPDPLIDLALVAMAQENYEEGEELLKRALALSPGNQAALYNLACLFSRQHRLELAQAWAQKLMETGFTETWRFSRDRDLANLRRTDWYKNEIAPDLIGPAGAEDPS